MTQLFAVSLSFATLAGCEAQSAPPPHATAVAKELGMELYSAKGPFSVSVESSDSPAESFVFVAHSELFSVSAENSEGDSSRAELRKALLSFGEGSSICCIYYPSHPEGDVRELQLLRKDFSVIDFNVDGQWDVKAWLPPNPRVEVFFKGEWQEVTLEDGSRYRRKLRTGGYVRFDHESGIWQHDQAADREGESRPRR